MFVIAVMVFVCLMLIMVTLFAASGMFFAKKRSYEDLPVFVVYLIVTVIQIMQTVQYITG